SVFLVQRLMDLIWVMFFYLNAMMLIPQLVYKKKYRTFLFFHVFGFTLVTLIALLFFNVMLHPERSLKIRQHILFTFFIYLLIMALSTAYRLIRDKMIADKLVTEKEKENLKTELSFLRSQVSPHFMFNVLNNMVSLARKKSDLLEPSLIQLSSLMRYMLYETDEEKVSLEKEIDYLQNYILLQQQRFGQKLKVFVSMHSKDDQYQIEPMLLIPLVENAFKHVSHVAGEAQIEIELVADSNVLQFKVSNMYNPSSNDIKDKTSGIGLPNVTRRLNLLYGNHHSLQVTRDEQWFKVLLKIDLKP
ncbi:MAG: histidine kinase, partial [Chitinophagaceae bacterium]